CRAEVAVSGYSIIVDPVAANQIREAHRYYSLRSARAASAFLDAVDGAMDFVIDQPFAAAPLKRDLRHMVLKRFPYAVYYRVSGNNVLVIALIHGKRHPREWRRLA